MGRQAIRCASCETLNEPDRTSCISCGRALTQQRLAPVLVPVLLVGSAVIAVLFIGRNEPRRAPEPASSAVSRKLATAWSPPPGARVEWRDPASTRASSRSAPPLDVNGALARAALASPVGDAVLVMPFTDSQGQVTNVGSQLALLTMYQAAYLPHRRLDSNFPEAVYDFSAAGAFKAGQRLAGPIERQIRRGLHRAASAHGELSGAAGAWEVRLTFDGTPAHPPVVVRAPQLVQLPGQLALEVHRFLGTRLSDAERAALARPEITADSDLKQLADLEGGAVEPKLRGKRADVLARMQALRTAQPESTYVAALWIGRLSDDAPERLAAELPEITAKLNHPLIRLTAVATPAWLEDGERAAALLDMLGVEYPRPRYHRKLLLAIERLGLWDAADRVEAFWTERQPASPHAHLARGKFLIDSAWHARGTGWGDTVTAEGSRLMGERLARARAELETAWRLFPDDPDVATAMINVCMGEGAPREEMEKWFTRGAAADPDDLALHDAKLEYLKPKWYGAPGEMLKFARETARTADGGRRALILMSAYDELACRSLDGARGQHDHTGFFRDPAIGQEGRAMLDQVAAQHPDDLAVAEWRVLLGWAQQDARLVMSGYVKDVAAFKRASRHQGWPPFQNIVAWAIPRSVYHAPRPSPH